MSGWIASLSAERAGNWDICVRNRLFGSPNPRSRLVARGDDLFIWLAKTGLIAYCVATSDAEDAGRRIRVPWPNPGAYKHVWRIDIRKELALAPEKKWGDIQKMCRIGRAYANAFPKVDDEACEALRRLFA